MADEGKLVVVVFYRAHGGAEPVREWLLALSTVVFGWPVGMPTCRSLGNGHWEVRSNLTSGRIARVLFCIKGSNMYLLHGFIKRSQRTPKQDLDAATSRRKDLES